MSRQFNVIVERDASGLYVATVPAIPGCHTQAASLDELMDRTREAIELCLEQEACFQAPAPGIQDRPSQG